MNIKKAAFEFSLKKGKGKKSHDDFLAGATWHRDNMWHKEDEMPEFLFKNGVTETKPILGSRFGHIERGASTYTPIQWTSHLKSMAGKEFRWAYEEDVMDFADGQK